MHQTNDHDCGVQCVERGLLGLDNDISTPLVEYKDIDVLTGFDDSTGKPILKKAEACITLRSVCQCSRHTYQYSLMSDQ